MAPSNFKPLTSIFIITFIFVFTFTCIPTVYSLPFVVFHGIADKCSGSGVARFTEHLSNWSGSQGHCIEIGNGARDSWFMPFLKQTAIACEKVVKFSGKVFASLAWLMKFCLFPQLVHSTTLQVKNMSELSEGYNIVGLSQGNMVGRGVIEFCDGGPPVKNFISLAGPHAGIASIPFCGSGIWCILVDFLIQLEVYSNFVQEHLAPANYIKIPTDYSGYIKGCKFLPKLNNEIANQRNSTYKERFSSLEILVLIMFEEDSVLVPKETSWFGYYPNGSWSTVLPAQETTLYIEDWIGLKTLDEAGKVKFFNVSGDHLQISYSDMKTYIVPYLEDEASTMMKLKESSQVRSSSISNFNEEQVRLTEDPPLLHIFG